MVKEEVLLKGP